MIRERMVVFPLLSRPTSKSFPSEFPITLMKQTTYSNFNNVYKIRIYPLVYNLTLFANQSSLNMKGPEPNTQKRNQKFVLAEKIILTTQKMKQDQKISFLSGYFISQTSIIPDPKNYQLIKGSLMMLQEAVINQIISATNFIEILVEASNKVLKMKPSLDEEKMAKFSQSCEYLMGEVLCNRRYLKQKWKIESLNGSSVGNQKSKVKQEIDEQTIKLIKMLEEEDKMKIKQKVMKQKEAEQKFKQFMKEEEKRFAENNKQKEQQKIICEVCSDEIVFQDIGTLSCGHLFHKKCIRSYIDALVSQKKVEIPCPSACGSILGIDDVEEFIDGDLKEKYDKFCFDLYVQKNMDKNVSWCPTAGCPAVFSHDGTLNNYRCPACSKHYCLRCRCIYHIGMTCAQYKVNNTFSEADKQFQQFAVGAKFKQCPKCNFWVERSTGCNSMSCRCGMSFCYDCGGTGCGHGSCNNSGKR